MTRAEEVVKKVAGRDYLKCYPVLICAVEVAYEHLPKQPQMKAITAEVIARKGITNTTVSKALSRAAIDVWDNGNRKALEEVYDRHLPPDGKPTPLDLTLKLAAFMDKPVEYRVWKEESSGKYGIAAADPVTGRWLAVAPFRVEHQRIEKFVRFLNRIHAPLEGFMDLFSDSGLLEIV